MSHQKNLCQCPKWHEVVSAEFLRDILTEYLNPPEYGKDFSIHQHCFMCANDDRTESYTIDDLITPESGPEELFGDLPHPNMLNDLFVGSRDGTLTIPSRFSNTDN